MDLFQELNNLNLTAVGAYTYTDYKSIGFAALLKLATSRPYNQKSVFDLTEAGYVKDEEDIVSVYTNLLTSNGGKILYKRIGDEGEFTGLFAWKDTIAELSINDDNYLQLNVLSLDEKLLLTFREFVSAKWQPREKTGQIYAIMTEGSRLTLRSIGNAGIHLERGNYTPKVLEDYDYVIKDLRLSVPSGRISIMRGSPGTGKTHLIRAMLNEVKDTMFVLIPPNMITNLAGPELLSLLTQYRSSSNGCIVLVLEDADKCLVARGDDNINTIQSLLNLGDGILGSLLDLRIIATTNADKLNMDPAIMRPGRLNKILDVEPLDLNTARSVFKRLLPTLDEPKELKSYVKLGVEKLKVLNSSEEEALIKEDISMQATFKMSLAEVYALARKYGWQPEARKISLENDNEDYDDE